MFALSPGFSRAPVRAFRRSLPWQAVLLIVPAALLAACGGKADTDDSAAPPQAKAANQREVLYWYDPMRPEVRFDKPGRSPFMDMDLVPMYADQAGGEGFAVAAEVVQTLGVRIGTVERDTAHPTLRATAQVRADQDGRWMLVSRAAGWIEKLNVHAAGDPVRAGAAIAEVYSPELVQVQEELLLSAANAPAAAERLRRLGIAEADIEAVRKAGKSRRRLPLRSPVSGTVSAIMVHHGSRVAPDQALIEIVPAEGVWVEARLFPGQAERLGEPVRARFRRPGDAGFEWRVEGGYLYPLADPVSQTQSLRFVVPESSRRLPPGQWLEAELNGAIRENVLLVPAEAVVRTRAGDRVVCALPDRRFEVVEVELGARYGDRYEVIEGLVEGDAVVVSGQFLLDSEAELRSGLRRLSVQVPAEAPRDQAQEHEHAH